MNSDDQKIIWKKGQTQKTDTQTDVGTAPQEVESLIVNPSAFDTPITPLITQDEISRIANRTSSAAVVSSEKTQGDIKSEIAALLGDVQTNTSSIKERTTVNPTLSDPVDEVDVRSDLTGEVVLDTPLSDDMTKNIVTSDSPVRDRFNVKDEIDKMLADLDANKPVTPKTESAPVVAPATNNELEEIEALKKGIQSELDDVASVQKGNPNKGIEQTYYADVSGAMGSNKPETLSQLLEKSRFEKKQAAILSPKSKKNILYIGGSLLLLALGVFLISTLFKSEPKVEFIKEKKVDSLVYSNLDTGLNITDIGAPKVKNAIRKVVETEIEQGAINQVYYAREDQNRNLRRLDIQDVFTSTGHTPPQLVYENIEPEFMHGVFKTDKNEPFLILKTVSYDQVFEGMKEWEPTIIDDLSSYFDLPAEAGDRSLIQDGFSDDVIKNKNVRVARFIPRERDRSFLDNIIGAVSGWFTAVSDSAYAQAQTYTLSGQITENLEGYEPIPFATLVRFNADGTVDQGNSVAADVDGNYSITLDADVGAHTLEARATNYFPKRFDVTEGNPDLPIRLSKEVQELDEVVITAPSGGSSSTTTTSPDTEYLCYQKTVSCIAPNGDQVGGEFAGTFGYTCFDQIQNGPNDVPQISDTPLSGYSCIKRIKADNIIDTTNNGNVCFHAVTGQKLNTTDTAAVDYVPETNPLAVCFAASQCRAYECFNAVGESVPTSQEGNPGISCRETNIVPGDYQGRKICREYTDLTNLTNINQSKLCFDENGNFVQSFVQGSDANPGNDITCITPTNRATRLCLNQQNKVVSYDPAAEAAGLYRICFEPLDGAGSLIEQGEPLDDGFSNWNQEMRQRVAAIARQIEIAAALANLFGVNSENVQKLNNAAQFLYELSYTNVLQIEQVEQALVITKILENVVNTVDPNQQLSQPGPDGEFNLIGKLRNAINLIKDIFGFTNNLAWATVGNKLPLGVTIGPGETVEGVDAIQQVLVLTGLMEEISVNGTLDLVTQGALSNFQAINGLPVTGIADPGTLNILSAMADGQSTLYGDLEIASINDYFDPVTTIGLGSYSDQAQALQILLYAEGYNISAINGVFDNELCEALLSYQEDNQLEPADLNSCVLSAETIESLNTTIQSNDYLGSGFTLTGGEALQGTGTLSGLNGPGSINFGVNEAEAASLNEGDIILMYTFLDEQTILITRHASVITEIIERRALDDIFTQ